MNEEMTICEAHVRIKELEKKLKEEQKLLEHYMEKFERAMVILIDHKDFWKIYED